jgi:hypothetical protein
MGGDRTGQDRTIIQGLPGPPRSPIGSPPPSEAPPAGLVAPELPALTRQAWAQGSRAERWAARPQWGPLEGRHPELCPTETKRGERMCIRHGLPASRDTDCRDPGGSDDPNPTMGWTAINTPTIDTPVCRETDFRGCQRRGQ